MYNGGMSDLGERNKTVITVGIALVSLSLGTILISHHSNGGSVSDASPVVENNQPANIAGALGGEEYKSLKPNVSAIPVATQKSGSGSDYMVSPLVSQSPNPTKTPSATPQTPTATPTLVKTPTTTPLKTVTPNPSLTPNQTPPNSPPPTASLNPTPTPTQPNNNVPVIINEIGWMGTEVAQTGQYGEWLELYNPSNNQVDLSGWKILVSGELLLNLSGTINPGQYFLIERVTPSSPDPIIDIPGDMAVSFGSGGLNNNGDRIELIDSSGTISDLVDCSGGWFAGSNSAPKKSMERKGAGLPGNSSDSWGDNDGVTRNGTDKNGVSINGTPGMKNSQEI